MYLSTFILHCTYAYINVVTTEIDYYHDISGSKILRIHNFLYYQSESIRTVIERGTDGGLNNENMHRVSHDRTNK